MRLSELASLFDQYNTSHKKPRTAEFYREQLKRVLAAYGDLDAAELRPFHLLKFKHTWHLILSVQRLYRWAVDEMDLLQVNPVKKLRRPRLGARRRILAPAELLRLLRRARSDFRRLLLFARESAARPQELVTLRWEELRWEGDSSQLHADLRRGAAFFLLTDYKARTRRADPTAPRLIPVTPRLGRLLSRLLRGRPLAGAVLVADDGRAWNKNSVRMRMKRLLQRSGLPELLKGEKVCCYTLRHTSLTSLVAQGFDTSVVQQLAGHANITTTSRYVHLHRKHLMNAWEKFHKRQRGRPGR